ncbi:RpnC/YadD family protein [Ornithinibacillus halophilus]|uniref:Transposase, YhgA-like n=1 Tax=Ornithinibacillus halophilus TaxID=930117 RepID=A0A1M5P625_9BACI|nr:hypothetical protein SAMN05216225_11043 [Ornithinibacillus halophilus]
MSIASVVYKPTPENSHNNVIHEDTKEYNQHDYLFKKLIHNFFEEFLEAFFPEVHEHIDFSFIKPMSEEVFNDLTKGSSKRADIVIETKLKEENTLVIIHVEPQSTLKKIISR